MRAAALRTYRQLLDAARVMDSPTGAVDRTLERVATLLTDAGIAFAVAGGFAVLAHGYERFTNDVDLLVRASDLSSALRVLRAAGFRGGRTPLGAKLTDEGTGVVVDLLGSAFEADETALTQARRAGTRRLPVVPVAHLILMKLESGRSQDDSDIVELLKARVPAAKVARYLRATWPALLPRFKELVARSRAEQKRPQRRRGPAVSKIK